MRILLDTHAFLWWIDDDSQLSGQARTVITDTANELFFSAASGWEIAIKTQIGKLRFPPNLEQFILKQIQVNSLTVLPMHLSHTLPVYTLPVLHRDPFDRILIAQSQIEAMPILTSDGLIGQYAVETIW